jgi:hypothetical protein
MFELFLARDLPANLTGQIRRHCAAGRESLPARLMGSILLAFSIFVAGRIATAAPAAPASKATPPGNPALQCPAL